MIRSSRSSRLKETTVEGDGPDVDPRKALAGQGHLPEDVAIFDHREGDLLPALVYLVELNPALLEDEKPLGALSGNVEDVVLLEEGVRGPLGQVL
jgi:hypothetical protein